MFFSRDDYKNVLGYFDYSRICNVTSKFTELSPDMLSFEIKFPMSKSQRSIEWRNIHIPGFRFYFNQIHRNTYYHYKFPKGIFKGKLYIKVGFIYSILNNKNDRKSDSF